MPRYAAAKVASLLRSQDPLNSGLLVRCCEGGLRCKESAMPRGRVSSPLRTSSTSVVRLFFISNFVLFFCLLAVLLIPTSPYSIEQYNMRD